MSDSPLQKMPLFSKHVKIVIVGLIIFAGCFWAIQSREVGRYQFFVKDNNVYSYVYVLDTKTSRLFLRSIFDMDMKAGRLFRHLPEEKAICLDLGTVNHPLQIESESTSGYETWKAENERMKVADGSSDGHNAKENWWEQDKIVSESQKATKAQNDIFDQIEEEVRPLEGR